MGKDLAQKRAYGVNRIEENVLFGYAATFRPDTVVGVT